MLEKTKLQQKLVEDLQKQIDGNSEDIKNYKNDLKVYDKIVKLTKDIPTEYETLINAKVWECVEKTNELIKADEELKTSLAERMSKEKATLRKLVKMEKDYEELTVNTPEVKQAETQDKTAAEVPPETPEKVKADVSNGQTAEGK